MLARIFALGLERALIGHDRILDLSRPRIRRGETESQEAEVALRCFNGLLEERDFIAPGYRGYSAARPSIWMTFRASGSEKNVWSRPWVKVMSEPSAWENTPITWSVPRAGL